MDIRMTRNDGRKCMCGRILIPEPGHLWPYHFSNIDTRTWCPISGTPVLI